MLYRFYSQTCAEIILLPAVAHTLLACMGKDAHAPQGIVPVADLPHAIAALEQAIAAEQAHLKAQAQTPPHADESDTPDEGNEALDKPPAVRLQQRAYPVLDLLRRSLAAEQAVLWRT